MNSGNRDQHDSMRNAQLIRATERRERFERN
jgi:hypothetical protein